MFGRLWRRFVRWYWIRKLVRVGLSRTDAEMYVSAVLGGKIPTRKFLS